MIRNCSSILAIATLSLAMFDIHPGQAASQTLEKIKEVGKIAFGYREASIPFAYLGADNKPTGLSLELCAAVAGRIKSELKRPALEIEYIPVNASNRIPLLQNGTIDIECGSTTNTAERQKQVSFSIATYVASPRWLVAAASPVTELIGLDGQTIVVTQGSLNLAGSPQDHRRPEAECEDRSRQGPRRIPFNVEYEPRCRMVRGRHPGCRTGRQLSRPQNLPHAACDLRADLLRADDPERGS